MLHIGHFSYDELDENAAVRHGYFTCVLDAEDPEQAAAMFAAHILEMKKSDYFFANIVKVYVEDIIKIPEIPSSPMTTLVQSCRGEFPESISYSLPFGGPDDAEAYGLRSNVFKHEALKSDEFLESNPFMDFKTRARQLLKKGV